MRALQQRMLNTPGGDREMVEILALVLQHDEQAVLAAVGLAFEAGAPTKTHILSLLHRLVGGKAGQIAGRLTYSDLVILDELGYLSFSASGGELFHLLSKLYERTSVIITTNREIALGATRPRGRRISASHRLGT